MSSEKKFTKDNVNDYLKELSKVFRKLNGTKTPAEIILIGGSSVLVNYGFRYATSDIDAIIQASSAMKEAINIVGDKYDLPNNWLNNDFQKTASFSPKLIEYSTYYKTFSNIVQVRTIKAEYLIAMKLISARRYKRDRSDVIGILKEEQASGNNITLESIQLAIKNLYGDDSKLTKDSKTFIQGCLKEDNLEKLYKEEVLDEENNKDILVSFEKNNPGELNKDNLDEVLKAAKKVKKKK